MEEEGVISLYLGSGILKSVDAAGDDIGEGKNRVGCNGRCSYVIADEMDE